MKCQYHSSCYQIELLARSEKKTVLVKTTGHKKAKYIVALGCMADGTKLKRMVIFKHKTMPKEKFTKGVLVHVHPKGWMQSLD